MNTPNQSQQILIPTVHAAPSGLKARHVMARAGVSSANAENSPTNPTFAIAKTLEPLRLRQGEKAGMRGSSHQSILRSLAHETDFSSPRKPSKVSGSPRRPSEFKLNPGPGRCVKNGITKLFETGSVPVASLLVSGAYHFLVARKFTFFGVFTSGPELPHDAGLKSRTCHLIC